jgi:hypothetical protein
VNNPDTPKPSGRRIALRHVRSVGRHLRSNVVAYLALAVAVGSGGSYALAAVSASNGTINVCVDNGTGVMHLAKHPRCGRGQSRIGLSSALDRPTGRAWAAVEQNGAINVGSGLSITHAGVGTYNVTVTARTCRNALNNAPVVSVDDGQPPGGFGDNPGAFPVSWTEGIGFTGKNFIIHTGVVVNGDFQPKDETFNLADSCGFAPGT